MKPRRFVRSGIVLFSLLFLGAAGYTSLSGAQMGSGDVVADRQRLMKLNGASWKDIQDKAKAGNIEAIAVNAETLALNAMHIPALFPAGSLTEKSKAKAEIWQKWDQFAQDARTLQELSEKLRDAAKAKDAEAVQALVKDYGKQACGACHTPFRQPTS